MRSGNSSPVVFAISLLVTLSWMSQVAVAGEEDEFPAILDGKTFVGTIAEDGSSEGQVHTFIFSDHKFRSEGDDQHVFEPAIYTATYLETGIRFEARTQSEKQGQMSWTGMIVGNRIAGSMKWTKGKKTPVEYTFTGELKE